MESDPMCNPMCKLQRSEYAELGALIKEIGMKAQ